MFQNRVVLITGAGSGLGAQLAAAFSNEGAKVIGIGRSDKSLRETASKLADRHFRYFSLDVNDFSKVSNAVAEIIEQYGTIDYLYNNAAVYPKVNFLNEGADDFCYALSVNVCGIANCCKAVLPHMIQHGFGRIYNIGSWAHKGIIENSAAYSCSKGAVHSLTKAIFKDIEALGLDIEIHEWVPGRLNTAMGEYSGIDPALTARWGVNIARMRYDIRKSRIYENDVEWIPPKPLKQRIISKILFWRTR